MTTTTTLVRPQGATKRDVARYVRPQAAVPVGPEAAKAQLGCALNTIFKLAHHGAVEAVRGHDGVRWTWTFWLVPGMNRIGIYEAWVARVLRWNHTTAKRHKDLREACAVPDSFGKPAGLDQFLCATFAAIGVSTRDETIPYFVDRNRKAVDRDRIRGLMAEGDWRPAGSTGAPPMEPRLAAVRFPQLQGLPDTCLDKTPETEAAAPADALVGRSMALRLLAPGATMFTLVAAASGRSEKIVRGYVRGFEAIERRMDLLKLRNADGASVQTALMSMVAEAREGRKGCAALAEACQHYLTAERYLRGYVGTVDADGARGLRTMLLPPLPEPEKVRLALVKARTVTKTRGGDRRKHDSNRASGQLAKHTAASHNSMEQATAMLEAAAEASARLETHLAAYDALDEETRLRRPAFVEMLVPTTVLDQNGNLVRGASQTLVFWAWRERDQWLSLEPGALRRQRGMRRARKRRDDGPTVAERALMDASLHMKLADVRANPEKYNDVVFEFRGCIPGEEGGPTCEPRFVTLLRHSVDHSADGLSARRQRQRHGLMRAWNVRPIKTMPGGLLTFDRNSTAMRQWMLSRGRVMVPVTASYFAMLLGTLAFDILRTTLARVSEAIQPEQDLDRWKEDDATGSATIAFLAAVKRGRGKPPAPPVPMVVPEKLFGRIMETGRTIAIANGHPDGWLPDVDEPPDRPRERDPAKKGKVLPRRKRALVFQWLGRALPPSEVKDLVRWVNSNRGKVTPHVIRHAGANELREMGVAERIIQAILRHGSPRMTAWYAHRTVAQARKAWAARSRDDRVSAANEQARIAEEAAA